MKWISASLLAALLVCTTPALAAPAEVSEVIKAEKPFGQGRLRFLFMTAYTATLWTDAQSWSMDAPFALTLRYGMGFSTDEMVSRSLQEMKKVNPALDDAALKSYGAKLAAAFPPVKSGDTITALHVPGKPASFFRNGTATATLDDNALNADFFGIWLSPRSSEPALRSALLKGS